MAAGGAPRAGVRQSEPDAGQPAGEQDGAELTEHPTSQRLNIIGGIDGLIGTSVFGWAYDREVGRRRVRIVLYVNDVIAAETTANGLRRELVGVDGHDGFSGFVCAIPPEKFTADTTVRVVAEGAELGAPLILGPKHADGVFEPLTVATATGWVRERVLQPNRAVLDMFIDGRLARTVVTDRPRPELKAQGIADGCFGFAEALPESCLDGGEHLIEFRHRASGTVIAPGARRFVASFVGSLDRLDEQGGRGWVFCREAPDRPVRLEVMVNGEAIPVVADHLRSDVQATHGVEACGFEFHIPETISRHRALAVEISVAGTRNAAIPGPFSFTPMSRVIEELEGIAAQSLPRSPLRETIIPGLLATLRAQSRHSRPLDLALQLDLSRFKAPPEPVADIVDVVIPVYAGHDETVACIESVVRAQNRTRREIVVVDDCGPEPKLRAALQDYARRGAITLIVNRENLGFPGAANAGMALHPDRDVILLNADTLVPTGWIDRLRAASYRADNIGTVTPLSNRATICSYPEINKDNDLPSDMAWEQLDELCAEVNDRRLVELPTAVGFCAYLRRAMLRETGLLDTERWAKGYGEENELCILGASRGWKHVLAPNLFVVHHGAVSFGADGRKEQLESNMPTLDRLYPDYIPRVMDFIQNDPPAAARRTIDWARLTQLSSRFMLHVSHRNGGGTNLHIEDLSRRLTARGDHVLILEANSDDRGAVTIRNLAIGTKSVYALPRERETLVADLRAAGVWHVHFHQIMGGERWLSLPGELGCAYDVTVHDYAFFCPRIDLIDEAGRYCGEPAVESCERCVALGEAHPDLRVAYRDRGGAMAPWIDLHGELLAGARRVFTPSRDTARRMERHFPNIDYEPRHHPEATRRVAIRRPASSVTTRVALIGALGINKGSELLLACARDALKRELPIQFRLFGFASDDAELRRLDNVQVTGEYKRDDLPRLLAENPCDVALFLGIWPETYCYALSDAYAAGLYPIALGFGAIEERIADAKVGALLPQGSTAAEINAAILAEVARSREWPASVEIGEDCDDLLADYYGLQPPVGMVKRPLRRRNRS
jgi:GT2 family glycosyltransferase/glycosyltransferase involved in cell wall biosynthesis